ncbi:MAG TPA: FAD-dependent oxidoreductase [Solirubrobacteraceae bacterium]
MPRIVIAGGGIAGLEALVALREHLGADARIDLLEASTQLIERQHAVTEPFDAVGPRRVELTRIANDHDAHLRPDRLASVAAAERSVRMVRGETLAYDALLVAVGARPDIAVPGALTFAGPRDVVAYTRLLDDIDAGRVGRVAFALPTAVTWALPLYELALMTAEHVRATGKQDVGLVVVTPEHRPLDAFGERIASHIWSLMAERGIALHTDAVPLRSGPGGLVVEHGETVQVDRIVSLPRLGGPWIDGLPHDEQGFIPTDEHGAVLGAEAVWAAGDATAFPIKQGGLAAQQADAAAASIAAFLGADVAPVPFRPVLRGLLLDPRGPRFLDATRGDLPATPPWWPPTKVAAPRLGRYLAHVSRPDEGSAADQIDVGEVLLALAERHAARGERDVALRCFDAAEQVRGSLPEDAALRRAELAGARSAR